MLPPASFIRRQLSLILTLIAWLFATGSHWDLVQAFGWGRMVTIYDAVAGSTMRRLADPISAGLSLRTSF